MYTTLAYPTVRILFQCSSPEKHGNKIRIKIKAMIKKKPLNCSKLTMASRDFLLVSPANPHKQP